ncbi:PREDICTED: high mobility group protein DSP1-like [Amphimedon queenslandica]|uniref:HMG box domain-containing protein n=2 Tax=Amphimedon queenslandica TaxID=400682 RepID=A0AAN0K061_AMPQE|nr:PREDICTED: high mobility group protein DSP1-like [Amphimedon queenslandica]|eukprot:XP_019862547.1 PREDICTED: high mobility group protein DSP1-like [Amphimedon queenslandica]
MTERVAASVFSGSLSTTLKPTNTPPAVLSPLQMGSIAFSPVYRDIQQYIQQQQPPPPPQQHRPSVPQNPVNVSPHQPHLAPVQNSSPAPPLVLSNNAQPLSLPGGQISPLNAVPPGKDRSRPRGRMTPYAFFVQERREYYRRHGVPVEFTAFSKECSSLWKELKDDEKSRFQKMSEDDKERFRKESASYHASLGQPYRDSNSKRGRKRKEPGQPKRNMCAFLHFCAEKRPKLRVESPAASIGALAKQLSLAWKVMTPDQKRPYEDMAMRDKLRYEQQKQAYEAGYSAAVTQQGAPGTGGGGGGGANSTSSAPAAPTLGNAAALSRAQFDGQKPIYHPRRKRKDPDMPKRNMSAFMFYSKAKRPHLRAQNMTLRVGQLAQILAAQWKIMSPSEKKQFDDMARKDKERYEMQLKAYRKGEYIPMSDQHDIDQICNMYQ